jgi:histidinol dehydrogenase
VTGLAIRFRGPLPPPDSPDRRALVDRTIEGGEAITEEVRAIVGEVRRWGDPALFTYAERFDRVSLTALEVERAEWDQALERLDPPVRRALERAAGNLERAHRAFQPRPVEVETEAGVTVRRRPDPIERVGIYVPGGKAAYPSSVLMSVVPARIAGVGQIVVASPPGPDGRPHQLVLAACGLVGPDRLFAIGGAGAIAALAYGTATVPRVDKIVGPGNAYVMEAKLQVADRVAIDAPAGPSEVLILADDSAPIDLLAAELVTQAEHDPRAAVVAVLVGGDDARVAELAAAVERATLESPRQAIVLAAFASAGGILTVPSVDLAVEFANQYAAEHLLLALRDAERIVPALRNSGAVFIGLPSSVVFGDYLTGANHVLPTGGLARAYSGLSTSDFVRWTSFQTVTAEAAARLAADTAVLAGAEGLPAHAVAATARTESIR